MTTGSAPPPASLRIEAANGGYDPGVPVRNNEVRLFTDGLRAVNVAVNGAAVPRAASLTVLAAQDSGWVGAGTGEVRIKTGVRGVDEIKTIMVELEE